jgi:hypothetical protein
MTSTILNRPLDYRHVPAAQWTELSAGDPVWIYDVAWGAGTRRVDYDTQKQELLLVVLEHTGRRLNCGTDDVEVWAA